MRVCMQVHHLYTSLSYYCFVLPALCVTGEALGEAALRYNFGIFDFQGLAYVLAFF